MRNKKYPSPKQSLFTCCENPTHSEKWKDQDHSISAYQEAGRCVRKLLRFPSTAAFPNLTDCRLEHVSCLENQHYQIGSYVDSENLQGSIIRTHFTAELRQIALGRWTLLSLDMA